MSELSSLPIVFSEHFGLRNLRHMRSFYLVIPIQGTLRPELSQSRHQKLIALDGAEL